MNWTKTYGFYIVTMTLQLALTGDYIETSPEQLHNHKKM